MIGEHNPSELPCPDASWADYEDVTPLAQRTGIPYTVLLDERIRSLLELDIDAVEFKQCNHQEPLTIYVLVALRFLLTRFPSMTRFRFSCGAGREACSEKIPVLATFHQDQERGYFVALSLDLHKVSLDA